jgi:hypothetical protein
LSPHICTAALSMLSSSSPFTRTSSRQRATDPRHGTISYNTGFSKRPEISVAVEPTHSWTCLCSLRIASWFSATALVSSISSSVSTSMRRVPQHSLRIRHGLCIELSLTAAGGVTGGVLGEAVSSSSSFVGSSRRCLFLVGISLSFDLASWQQQLYGLTCSSESCALQLNAPIGFRCGPSPDSSVGMEKFSLVGRILHNNMIHSVT